MVSYAELVPLMSCLKVGDLLYLYLKFKLNGDEIDAYLRPFYRTITTALTLTCSHSIKDPKTFALKLC